MKNKYFYTITFTLLLFSSVCHSQIINFPDSNFKNALLNHDPIIDLNGDGEIQVSEAAAFEEEVNVNEKNITDLTGIGYFTNIIELRCRGNLLTTLDLSQNSLLFLDCGSNLLTSINVTNNPLWHFWCDNNQLEVLDISFIAELQDLDCSNNSLTTIDVSNSTNLVYFTCDNNALSELDISNLPKISHVRCENNLITNLDISNSPRLTSVLVSNNQITNLSLSNLPWLRTVDFSNNSLTTLDLSNVPSIENFYCSNNQISNINLSNSINLEILYASENYINEIDLSNCSELSELYINNNNLDEINISDSNINHLECNNNNLTNLDFDVMLGNGPYYLACEGNQLTYLVLNHPGVHVLKCADNPNMLEINMRNHPSNEYMDLSECSFYDLPLLNKVCIDDDPVNFGLINLILTQTGHNVDFYTSENCDVLLETPDNQILPLTISPNPVKNILNINTDYGLKSAQIFNVMGQNVFSEKNLYTNEINVSNLRNGIYFLELTDIENNSTIKKFIKD
ncbi:MAG: T9SS type A sorting domain-containing protein [Aequorivita sp.]|nr:T9SS type A sorting domain-containing protein [Aequorivita sp.]